MTEQEAVRRIKNHNEIHSRKEPFYAIHIAEALEMAVEALEKQIPKKVKQTFKNEYDLVYCPRCGVRFIQYGKPFCGECGQALDWSERNGGEDND